MLEYFHKLIANCVCLCSAGTVRWGFIRAEMSCLVLLDIVNISCEAETNTVRAKQ